MYTNLKIYLPWRFLKLHSSFINTAYVIAQQHLSCYFFFFRQENSSCFPTRLQTWHGVGKKKDLALLRCQRHPAGFIRHRAEQQRIIRCYESDVSVFVKCVNKQKKYVFFSMVGVLLLCQNWRQMAVALLCSDWPIRIRPYLTWMLAWNLLPCFVSLKK